MTEAEPLYQRSVSIYTKAPGPDHPSVGLALSNLGLLYNAQHRYAEAEPLYLRSLAILKKAHGPDHPDVGNSLNNLGELYQSQNRYAEAESLYESALVIRERALGPDHPFVGVSLNNLANLSFEQREWPSAAEHWRASTRILIRRAERGAADVGQPMTGKKANEAEQLSFQFWGLVKAAHRLAAQSPGAEAMLASEMFQAAQWALSSEAAASLAKMAARGAKGNLVLAAQVRERQDLIEEWQKRDGARSAAVALPPDKRDRAAEAANLARLTAIDARIGQIDKRLAADFPDYAALSRPTPVAVDDVQGQLGTNEALVLLLDTPGWKPTPEETFMWVMTKTDVRWVRSELGTPALAREVAALRCGLDAALWDDPAASARCRDLVKAAPQRDGFDNVISQTLPFDTARAHALYKALFGEVEDLIRDKQLLIVPSGPLTQLPFQVLVTAESKGTDYEFHGLARAHACHHYSAGGLLPDGPAPRGQAQRCHQAHDRLRQPATRRQSGRAVVGGAVGRQPHAPRPARVCRCSR